MYTPDYQNKLTAFVNRLAVEQNARKVRDYPRAVSLHNEPVTHNTGKVYTRIVIGSSCRYFVRVADGTIFASASYKTPNFVRSYGTLDTIDQFDWSGYNAVALPNSNFVMKSTDGHYMTARPK